MPILRLNIYKSEDEWKKIEELILAYNAGKATNQRGIGTTKFIANEVNRIFSKMNPDATPDKPQKAKHIKKNFCIVVSDEVARIIESKRSASGECLTTFITRIIIDPHLLDK
jgi:hypothetical protein